MPVVIHLLDCVILCIHLNYRLFSVCMCRVAAEFHSFLSCILHIDGEPLYFKFIHSFIHSKKGVFITQGWRHKIQICANLHIEQEISLFLVCAVQRISRENLKMYGRRRDF